MFVIRVAGNILNTENLGSVEYAVLHTGVQLIIVLGHKKCGAVAAAVNGGDMPESIRSIADAIQPAVEEAKKLPHKRDLVEEAAHLNLKNVVRQLKTSQPILAEKLREGKIAVVGAYYDLDTGKVEWFK
jgi:carbonic anhydrase